MKYWIDLPWPPTVNTHLRCVKGRVLLSKKGREYRKAVKDLVLLAKAGGDRFFTSERLAVAIALYAPTKARSDIDNRIKALLDAMQHAGCYDDDSQIDELWIGRSGNAKPGLVKVALWEI